MRAQGKGVHLHVCVTYPRVTLLSFSYICEYIINARQGSIENVFPILFFFFSKNYITYT